MSKTYVSRDTVPGEMIVECRFPYPSSHIRSQWYGKPHQMQFIKIWLWLHKQHYRPSLLQMDNTQHLFGYLIRDKSINMEYLCTLLILKL